MLTPIVTRLFSNNIKLRSHLFQTINQRTIIHIRNDLHWSNLITKRSKQLFKFAPKRNFSNELTNNQLKRNKIIGYWFLSCAGLTFVTVCAGGITRLTESGLSMVNWHLFKELPPFNQSEWEKEFENYKEYPEFKVKNSEITLEQFKKIWYMEYFHRMLGRSIGGIFFIPAIIFWSKGWFNKAMKIRVGIMGTLLAFQGLLGWYMVKSGLEEKEVYTHQPRVSQYRLAAHLGTALFFYSLLFFNGLVNISPDNIIKPIHDITPQLLKFKRMVGFSKLFIFTTILSGAFVAGLDAGLVYNSWPMMADRWIPTDLFSFEPKWKNFFENPTCVQFIHRRLGELTGIFVLSLWAYSFKFKLPPKARLASNILAIGILTQILLGITALINYVPIEIASMHQANAITTLTIAFWLSKELRWIKKIPK